MLKKILSLTCVAAAFAAVVFAGSPGFREICRGYVEKAGAGSVVDGVDGWLFFKDELQHLAAGKFWGDAAVTASIGKDKTAADPLPAIEEYSKLLAERGISLYLLPVPPKALIYPDKLAAGIDRTATAEELALYREFYGQLAARGVKIIDLLPKLLENRDKAALYCRTDTHFSGAGLKIFAEAAAAELKKEAWYGGVAKNDFSTSKLMVTMSGDLQQMAGGTGPKEEIELAVVSGKGDGKMLESDLKSP
jgi:alginate O-acetyltransferase complex protein AlgJ